MMHLPPLTALRCFEAVARLGGVTLAARELHVTHSAVSQQIKLLEELMGLALFVREGRRLRLTDEGRLYSLDIRAALRGIAQATQLAQGRPQDSELVIATLPSFALHWLLPRLDGFRAQHPYYRLRLQTSLAVQDLRSGLVDIGIRMGQGHWPDMEKQILFDDELLVVCSPRFRDGRIPLSAEEAMRCPLIRTPDAPWTDWCLAAGVAEAESRSDLLANDSNIVLAAVMLGQGIALERRSLVAGALARGDLMQITAISVPYSYPYWLVWQQQGVLKQKQRHFIEWIGVEVGRYLDGRN
ncbi:LysR family transcriptional regulator [Rugamonas sp. CCM 8940]|uniref:LysR substrate-binding domain-containing protein n=1 Tax=Rugamonas sp. CCM 8940 TaxID=2765359 RepID=UPI0018F70925|nr:LysR substrate-binding domain-containing protein [Rugamonas sp. CCM 8940]MBJ7314319.1 LysR family transcriptional regulator [Rugamonas sp. CCM 8940]